eukprot:10501302-Ditylum_brightwellii.AAC.1
MLSPSDYQVYKLCANPKDKKSVMNLLTVGIYKSSMWDALQVFQNKEVSHKERNGQSFTECLVAVTKNIFPIKAYKVQKKYIQNICKPLRMCSQEWISHTIKFND